MSVILPVYNRATVLGRAIESVLTQDFDDLELIVVDDGSLDESAAVAGAFQDRRLRLLSLSPNGGVSRARNEGIRQSSGRIICFLDSDDVYLPHKLSSVARRFRSDEDLGVLVDSFSTAYLRDGQWVERDRRNPVMGCNDAFVYALFNRNLWKATPAISVRREVALAAGLFDEALSRREDFDFLVRAARVARCASTDERLWTKCETQLSLSAPLDTFMPATVALLTRHPQYLADRRYRRGLARDLLRHLCRVGVSGRLRLFVRDALSVLRFSGGRMFRVAS